VLLAVDVGNTHTVLGLFDGETLVSEWRVGTHPSQTADELDVQLVGLLGRRGIDVAAVEAACVSSTVPPLVVEWVQTLRRLAAADPVVVGPGIRTGMPLRTENPAEVGPDRIANAVAALHRFGGPALVVDFGTSTNFDVVSAAGEYVGGAIAPGVKISMEALTARAARLGKIELVAPPTAIGRTTVTSMQSGAVYGFAGQVDGIVRRIWAELGGPCPTVATGGLAPLIRPHSETIGVEDPHLTLEGLRLLWSRNRAPTAPRQTDPGAVAAGS
jgi:type III pantothenate kinase